MITNMSKLDIIMLLDRYGINKKEEDNTQDDEIPMIEYCECCGREMEIE